MLYTVVAGLSIILAAVYTLNMVQKVFYGEANVITEKMQEITFSQKFTLSILVVFIFLFGVFPQPLFDLTRDTVITILTKFK